MNEAEWASEVNPAPLLRFAESHLTDRLRLLFMAGCCRRIWGLLTDRRFRRVIEMAEAVADGRATEDELEAAAGAVLRPGFLPPSASWPEPADGDDSAGRVSNPDGGVHTASEEGPVARELSFHELPVWFQQSYLAVTAIAPRGHLSVADRCEMAVGHYAGDRVAQRHPLHGEIRTLHDDARRLRRAAAGPAADAAEREVSDRVRTLTNEIWTAGAIERVNRAAAERAAQADLVRCLVGPLFRPQAVEPAWLTPTVRNLVQGIAADRAFDRLPILADALQDAGCDSADLLAHCRKQSVHTTGCWVVDLLRVCESTRSHSGPDESAR